MNRKQLMALSKVKLTNLVLNVDVLNTCHTCVNISLSQEEYPCNKCSLQIDREYYQFDKELLKEKGENNG